MRKKGRERKEGKGEEKEERESKEAIDQVAIKGLVEKLKDT